MNAILPAARGLRIRALHPVLGAEVEGVDPAALPSPSTLAELRRALSRHHVLVFRGARLSPAAQVDFTTRLGALEQHPAPHLTLPGERGIVVEEPGRDDRELDWHADLAWSAVPSRYSAQSAEAIEDGGWVTEFAGLFAAYDRLDMWLRERIEFLEVEHDHPRRHAAGAPPAVHPLVRIEPGTGRRALFLDAGSARRIVGLHPAESADLLHRLQATATHPSIVFRHAWRTGDLLVWDNLAVLHRLRYAAQGRLLRTMVRGVAPVGPRQVMVPWVSAG
jgi:taurine dioxygenase